MGKEQNTGNCLESAWDLLIEKYQPSLEKRAAEIWPGDKDAIDMVIQNVWVNAFATIDQVDSDPESYLYACLEDQLQKFTPLTK